MNHFQWPLIWIMVLWLHFFPPKKTYTFKPSIIVKMSVFLICIALYDDSEYCQTYYESEGHRELPAAVDIGGLRFQEATIIIIIRLMNLFGQIYWKNREVDHDNKIGMLCITHSELCFLLFTKWGDL